MNIVNSDEEKTGPYTHTRNAIFEKAQRTGRGGGDGVDKLKQLLLFPGFSFL